MNVLFQHRMPFVLYADCEALCTPHDEKRVDSKFYSHHVPWSIGYKLLTDVPVLGYEAYQSHPGADVVVWFMGQMLDLQGRCMDCMFKGQGLVMTLNDETNFARAFECYICYCPFNKDKLCDKDHLTGRYRGAAHERCKLMVRKISKVPVFFDNFACYDSQLIVWGFRSFTELDIKAIGYGMEKYVPLGWDEHMVFKDRLQFLIARSTCWRQISSGRGRISSGCLGPPSRSMELHTRISTCCSATASYATSTAMHEVR